MEDDERLADGYITPAGYMTDPYQSGQSSSEEDEAPPRRRKEEMADRRQVSVMGMDEEEDDGGADSARLEIVESLMRQWEAQYSSYTQLKVFVGTFNINGQMPSVSLAPWLRDSMSEAPDVYAIGFQELDLSQTAFFNGYSARENDWAQLCFASLHSGAEYEEVERSRLVGMLLIIYAKKSLAKPRSTGLLSKKKRNIDQVFRTHVGTGILNRGGNKGGVAVSLFIADTSILFVCCHLAAGSDELARRNQDYREISRLCFGPHRRSFFDHDAIFWLGDLNYRFNDLSADMVAYTLADHIPLEFWHQAISMPFHYSEEKWIRAQY